MRPPPAHPALLALVLSVLAASASRAQETVSLALDAGDRVAGTLRPAGEIERFVIDLPAGAELNVVARGKGGPVPALVLLGPDDGELARGTSTGKKTALAATTSASGRHVVRLTGDGAADGDYVLKAKASPVPRFKERSATDLASDDTFEFPFAAPAGAIVKATVAPRNSAFAAADVVVIGPAGAVGATTSTRGNKIRVTTDALAATGDYVLRFRNAGADGAWKARIDVAAAAPARRRIDITDTALQGTFGGTQAVFGARATPDADTVIVPAAGALNLTDMQVNVPAGAVTAAAVVSIAEVEPFFVDDATFSAGDAVRLEPAGTAFEAPVEVTLPFLAQSFDDPVSELVVVRRDDETGEVEELAGPFDVDVDTGTVTFATSTFSSFQAVSREDRPVKGTFLEVVVRPRLDDDGGALTLATNLVHGDFGDRTQNPADRARTAHTLTWSSRTGVTVTRDEEVEIGTFRITSDEEVSLVMPSGTRAFRRGRTPNALVAAGVEDDAPRMGVLLRRTQGTPSPGALSGAWHAFVLEAGAAEQDDGGVTVRLLIQRLSLDVAPDGEATASKVVRLSQSRDLMFPEWQTSGDRRMPPPGTLTPARDTGDAGFAALLDMELGARRFLTRVPLFPALSGDLLIGTAGAENDGAGAVRLVVLVRQSQGTTAADLAGDSLLAVAGFRVGGAGGAELTDAATSRDLRVARTKRGKISGEGEYARQDRGARPVEIPSAFDATWKMKSNGLFREVHPLRDGALTPRGELYVDTDVRGGLLEIGFGVPAAPR